MKYSNLMNNKTFNFIYVLTVLIYQFHNGQVFDSYMKFVTSKLLVYAIINASQDSEEWPLIRDKDALRWV